MQNYSSLWQLVWFNVLFYMRLTFVHFVFTLCCLFALNSCRIINDGFATRRDVVLIPAGKNTPKSASGPPACSDFRNYMPDTLHPEFTPLRYVRVNFHFVNSADSTQNFVQPDAIRFSEELLKYVNYNLANNKRMFLPPGNQTPVLPTQYRYVLQPDTSIAGDKGIYFHYADTVFICNKKDNTQRSPFSLFYNGQFDRFGVRKGEVINVFFLEHPPDSLGSATYKFTTNGVGKPDWAKIVGAFYHYQHRFNDQPDPLQATAVFIAGLFNHELGHSLGLAHTWNLNDGCDDTPQHPNYWNYPDAPADKQDQISNNVMDYNAYENAWSPCQIGKVQMNLASSNTLQRRMQEPFWCQYRPNATIRIAAGDSVAWLGAKDFEGDIVLQRRAKLRISCRVSLPQNARVVVKKRARLYLDGGTLTNVCGQKWQGIAVQRGLFAKGKIILQNNAQVLNALHPVWQITEAEKRKKK